MTTNTCTAACRPYINNSLDIGAGDYTCTLPPPLNTIFSLNIVTSTDSSGNLIYSVTFFLEIIVSVRTTLISFTIITNSDGSNLRLSGLPSMESSISNISIAPILYPIFTYNHAMCPFVHPSLLGLTFIQSGFNQAFSFVIDPWGSSSTFKYSPQARVTSGDPPPPTPISVIQTTCVGCQTTVCHDCQVTSTCGNTRVPIINLLAQTTIDGTDVGEADFVICDEFVYYKEEPLPPNSVCSVNYLKVDQLKETKFLRCCPFMVQVVKGQGRTFYDKVVSIYNKFSVMIGVGFSTFYYNMILYGMIKYILARILYGNFNIHYLLGKYNKKFLHDLGNSRFCEFIEEFEDCNSPVFGYNKFFKYDL
jgi:hypothetical protein